LLTQASNCGGSALTLHTAVAVNPRRSLSYEVLAMATADGMRRMAALNVFALGGMPCLQNSI